MNETVNLEQALAAQKAGNPSLAFELFNQLLQAKDCVDARYGAALAAARLGSLSVARHLLQPLISNPPADLAEHVNCLSLLGRLEKDRFARESQPAEKIAAALRSAQAYANAYQLSQDYYPGANAATMFLLAQKVDSSQDLLKKVLPDCIALLDDNSTQDPWLAATLGELYLLNNETSVAEQWYNTAALLMGSAVGNIATMRRQLRLLAPEISAATQMLQVLSIPTVITITGHMIDALDCTQARFPADIEGAVRQYIEHQLESLNAGIGYCSAACGVDILFAEALLARNGEVHIYLPFSSDDFLTTSVAFAGQEWVSRYHRVIEQATSVRYATNESYLGDDLLFAYNADVITGEMLMRAERLEVTPAFLAIYDFASAAPTGGSLATANSWQQQGLNVTRLDIAQLRKTSSIEKVNSATATQAPASISPINPREIHAMVFADIVGFSKLGEADTPHFFVGLLSAVAKLIDRYEQSNQFKNTWGDGLFLVFDELPTAAAFSLELRDLINQTDWSEQGLPAQTNIRIALHVGPVYPALDPILQSQNFFGTHVNQAARMEPITSPGSVFVSDQAAALIRFKCNDNFACDYLGPAALPKDAGTIGLHRLRHRHDVE